MNGNTPIDSFFFCLDLSLSHWKKLFWKTLLSAFLSSKPFGKNKMHCEIIDRYFNVLFVEIILKYNCKKLEKCFLGAQTCIPVSQTDWIRHCHRNPFSFEIYFKLFIYFSSFKGSLMHIWKYPNIFVFI